MATLPPRLTKAQQKVAASDLDAVLISSPAATTYLSGCYLLTQTVIPEREAYVLIPREGSISYLVCNIEEKMAREDSWIDDVHTYVEFKEAPATAVANLLQQKSSNPRRIGLEIHTLAASSYRLLQQALFPCEFVSWDQPMAELMMVKESDEIVALETAGRVTLTAITQALTEAVPGSSERTVFTAMMTDMMTQGLLPMFNVFTSGPNTLLVHGEPGSRILQPGDLIRLDVGGRWPSHYLSDMARTAVVGPPAPAQATNHQKLFQAQRETIETVRPGIPVSELYQVCAQSYARQQIPFTMPHIGHSMGIGLHEYPLIHPGETAVLQPGMVLNIEPFLADASRGEGYHVEDLVLVTESGYRLLTTPTPELIQLPV